MAFPYTHDESDIFKDLSVIDEKDKMIEDLLADCGALEANESVKKRAGKTLKEIHHQQKNDSRKDESKKMVHREIERQRRQEMSALYTSLRSLLPLRYVKGKRAISDHMHQATNYIKDMEKEIEEMKMRRDKLKKCTPDSNIISDHSTYHDRVKVNLLSDEILEIIISVSLNDQEYYCFPLSKLISDLVARDLNVIACASTTAHQSSIHNIQIQIDETSRSIDVKELQERLVNLIRLR